MITKRFTIFLIIFVLSLGFSQTAFAKTFSIDPVYSSMYFRIDHLVGKAGGIFARFDGEIAFDENKERIESITATIDLSSLDTGNGRRDKDLKSERFFDTKSYPEATFVSSKISRSQITGDLTLKGVKKRVKLDYEFGGIAKDQFGREKIGLMIKGEIDRTDFGIDFNPELDDGSELLGEDVELQIDVQGVLQK